MNQVPIYRDKFSAFCGLIKIYNDNQMKIVLSILIIILIFNLSVQARLADSTISLNSFNKHLEVGEEITYVVKYAFLNLGEVRFKITGKEIINGITVFRTIAYIDSYEGLPFVTIHQVYKSIIDSSYFPLFFLGTMLDDDTTYTEYSFLGDSVIYVLKGNSSTNQIYADSSVYVDERFQDGLSILYFARMNTGRDTTLYVPCLVNEEQEITTLKFYSDKEQVEIDAVDYEIDCLKLDGSTDFVSVFGFTGEFEGWFSNDIYSIPIIASMNVLIGNITLELINWNLNNWDPPEYKD
jgi:hypothetical protein